MYETWLIENKSMNQQEKRMHNLAFNSIKGEINVLVMCLLCGELQKTNGIEEKK